MTAFRSFRRVSVLSQTCVTHGIDRHLKTPLDFGSLVHQVVEDFGRDEAARELESEGDSWYFVEQLRTVIATRYGSKPPLPVQAEIAERRLQAAAHAQASTRRAGGSSARKEKLMGKLTDWRCVAD